MRRSKTPSLLKSALKCRPVFRAYSGLLAFRRLSHGHGGHSGLWLAGVSAGFIFLLVVLVGSCSLALAWLAAVVSPRSCLASA